jgi:PhzF family phenazine biosynthesis protein
MPNAYRFHLVNVFTIEGDRLSGNPLCVLDDARGLNGDDMQAIARQMNLSETTFVLPAENPATTARVRIFTPGFEMPFAGHPTLGTAAVIGAARQLDRVVLDMPAGHVPVVRGGEHEWTLRTARAVTTRKPDATRAQLAAMLTLGEVAFAGEPLWVNTGVEQLVLPLVSAAYVQAARPVPELIRQHGLAPDREEALAYVWARHGGGDQRDGTGLPRPGSTAEGQCGVIEARFFFTQHGAVVEDPATGSACANLGGWLVATGAALPAAATVFQGAAVGRPSQLGLRVDAAGSIEVTGSVVMLGSGALDL